MKNQPPREHRPANHDESVAAIMLSIADTTWRMVVPPALLVPGGLYADLHWGTKPFATLVAAAVGLGIGVALIKQQLKEFE